MHFCVLAKSLHLSGGDHIHAGTVVGKLERERSQSPVLPLRYSNSDEKPKW